MSTLHETVLRNARAYTRDLGRQAAAAAPKEVERWVDAVRRGRIFFYNTREVEIGLSNIDWNGGHIEHQEWRAQLNRFPWLRYLCDGYQTTGDRELPRLARQLLEDWIVQHAYSADAPLAKGDNTLNLSIRLGQSGGNGWWPAVADFNCPEVFDEPFLQRMIESSAGQLAYLRQNLAPRGNWRISQLDTLLTLALILPEHFDEHRVFATRHLNETFHRQIHADGSHEEHNPSYHGWMCRVFTAFWRLAAARPALGLTLDSERVARMWDYALFSTAPDGGSAGLHDGGCWHADPSRKKALSALCATRCTIAAAAGRADPEAAASATHSQRFDSAGQLFLRSGMTAEDEMMIFDATRWGGGHCHLSRNALSFFSGGRMLLLDPGVFSYEASDPFLVYGKSTPAHNTLTIDLMNQSEANPDLHDVALLPGADIVSCTYAGGYYPGTYTWGWWQGKHPGLFTAHTRTLLWLHNRCALVWDHARFDRPGQMYGLHWQFPAGPSGCDPETRRTWSAATDARNILVQELGGNDPLFVFIAEGDNATPPAGWLPRDAMGGRQAAPQARFHAHAKDGATTVCSLLLPFDGATPPAIVPQRLATRCGVWGFRLSLPDGTELLIAASDALGAQIETAGPIATDASLVAVTLRDGQPIASVGYGGMYLEVDGKTLVDKKDPSPWSRTH